MTDSQLEMKEKLLIESAARDLHGKRERFSEWRMSHVGLGSAFQFVSVNKGFQNRDFQTIQGNVSVIDPEVLGKLRKEASTIWNINLCCQKAISVALYVFCAAFFLGFHWLSLVPEDVLFISFIVTLGVAVILSYVAGRHLGKNADTQVAALVETYQPIFLQEYGVEIGYGRFNMSQEGGWNILPAIYLRRPQRLVDEEVAPQGSDSDDLDGRFPPIYLSRLIPGEILIDEKEYDAASMKVDAETWALLQSTHQKMIKWPPLMNIFWILLLLVFFLGCYWVSTTQGGFIVALALIPIVCWAYEYVMDKINLRVYCEVTKLVNDALRKGNGSRLEVEFHSSEVPGREGKHSRRYQFVQLNRSPTNELV